MAFEHRIQMIEEHPLIPMVPLLMREENKKTADDYEPKVVSLGPYHHGKEKLKFVEDFKPKAVEMFIGNSGIGEDVFMAAIQGEIEYVRGCYQEEFTCNYSDKVFAKMMLRDACVILNHIGPSAEEQAPQTIYHLGTVVYSSIIRDMFLLENNQVPFRILKMLVFLRYGIDGQRFVKLMEIVFSQIAFGLDTNIEEPNETNNLGMEPPHLLEIVRRTAVTGLNYESTHPPAPDRCCAINNLISCFEHCCCCRRKEAISPDVQYAFHSVTDLKSKGIHFKASGIKSLKGVRFSPSPDFYQSAKLELPTWHVTMYTRVFFRNMIAYEFSPHFSMPKSVTAYARFMKFLVVSKEDVKELRENEILINRLGSDEQVVQVYNALNTYIMEDVSAFWEVRRDVEEHYNNKIKTWMADLRAALTTKYFNNPWSIIVFAASVLLLCLDIVQTYYAAHPADKSS